MLAKNVNENAGMLSARGALAIFASKLAPTERLGGSARDRGPVHLLAQAQRAHIRPDFFDVGQAFFLHAALAHRPPAFRHGLVIGPDGILFFVVDHYLKQDVVAVKY